MNSCWCIVITLFSLYESYAILCYCQSKLVNTNCLYIIEECFLLWLVIKWPFLKYCHIGWFDIICNPSKSHVNIEIWCQEWWTKKHFMVWDDHIYTLLRYYFWHNINITGWCMSWLMGLGKRMPSIEHDPLVPLVPLSSI